MAMSGAATETHEFDEAKSEAFADRFMDWLNASSLMMMSSIGHRTGLFDAMDGIDWSTGIGERRSVFGMSDKS